MVFFFLFTRPEHQILLSQRSAAIYCDPLRSVAMDRVLFIASAGTATAIMSGSKTINGVLNVKELGRWQCDGEHDPADYGLPTILDEARALGYHSGVVSSARLTHATPAAAYAVCMAAASNTRYLLVNSLEAYGLPALPPSIRTLTSFVVRTGNNYLGSANWIWWAKFRGLQ